MACVTWRIGLHNSRQGQFQNAVSQVRVRDVRDKFEVVPLGNEHVTCASIRFESRWRPPMRGLLINLGTRLGCAPRSCISPQTLQVGASVSRES